MKEWISIWFGSSEGKRTLKICLIILGVLFLILLLNWGIDLIFGE